MFSYYIFQSHVFQLQVFLTSSILGSEEEKKVRKFKKKQDYTYCSGPIMVLNPRGDAMMISEE